MKIGVKGTKEKLSDYGGRRTNEMLSFFLNFFLYFFTISVINILTINILKT